MKGRMMRIIAVSMAMIMTYGANVYAEFVPSKTSGESESEAEIIDDDYLERLREERWKGFPVPSDDELVINSSIQPVQINEYTFPDPNFRAVVSGPQYDLDGNGTLDERELTVFRNLHCDGENIKSLKGIEYLVELRGLYCTNNQIEDWDLSNNKLLQGIWCSKNQFTSMDLSGLPDLEWVYCHQNNITYLNVSDNPKMSYIEANDNPLHTIDVSHNPVLEHLMVGYCELKELDLSHNPNMQHLDAFGNHFKKLDVTCCPRMKRLDVWDNHELGSIDVSQCPGLQYYNCAYNGATSVDVSHNPELTKLSVAYNSKLTKLDLSNNPKLVYLDCAICSIQNLDLSHNPKMHFLQAFTNPFTTLDIGYNPFLIKTYNEGEMRDESAVCQGHSWTIDYGGEDSTQGDHIYFLCFDDKVKLLTEPKGEQPLPYRPGDEEDLPSRDTRVTREMMVQTLYVLAGKPDVSGLRSRFKDVEAGAWYEAALLWGEANSICVGYPYVSADNFGIGKVLQREDMAYMLMRYSELMNYKRSIDFGRTDDYIDYFEIDDYCWEAMTWAVTWRIMEGKGVPGSDKSEQRIDPHGKVTRTELQKTFDNLCQVNNLPLVTLPIPGAPTPIPGQPTETPVPAKPTTVPGQPTTAPGQPTAAPGQPTAAPGQPTTAPGQPTKAPGQPTKAPVNPTPVPGDPGDPSFEDFVERLYVVALGRRSEKAGKDFWVENVENGTYNGADCARYFLLESPEFINRGLNDSDFLDVLYHTFYDRDADANGKAYWLGRLSGGTSKWQVVNDFIESTEWCNVCATYGVRSGAVYHKAEFASKNATRFATRLYTCCLGREPEKNGLAYWSLALTNLEQTGCSSAKLFFTSEEFVNFHLSDKEYLLRLYTTFMDRQPEGNELSYWLRQLENGTFDRYSVLRFFGESPEFRLICKAYGIDQGEM